jgi:hypothetical protein
MKRPQVEVPAGQPLTSGDHRTGKPKYKRQIRDRVKSNGVST